MFLKIEELKHVVIGRIKDAGYNAIQIDCNEWLTLYPQLTDYRIEVISPSGEIYFADTTMQGGVITWKLTARDTFQVGNGQYQVVAVGGNGERKTSSHPKITILEIANGTDADVPPDLSDAWTDTVIRNANAAIDAAEISKQNSEVAIDSANRAIALAEEISEAINRAEDAAERAEAAAERAESAGGSGGSAGGIVTEIDPTVYDWAKQPQKPTYTADEVNAIDKDELPQAIDAALAQAKENGEFDGAPGLKGDPGADGGYYQPSVTDGVLSWTPSNGDMPSVPAFDVRGPAGQDGQPGKSGVHYGPDEPTDPEIKAWINPEGEGDPLLRYDQQALTKEQQAQARENIGAADTKATGEMIDKLSKEIVSVNPQELTDEQKSQALENLGMVGGIGGIQHVAADLTSVRFDNYYLFQSSGAITPNSTFGLSVGIAPIEPREKYRVTLWYAPPYTNVVGFYTSNPNGDWAKYYLGENAYLNTEFVLVDSASGVYEFIAPENATWIAYTYYTAKDSFCMVANAKGTNYRLPALKIYNENLSDETVEYIRSLISARTQKTYGHSLDKPFSFSGKKLAAFGDSITFGITSPSLQYTYSPYIKTLADKFGMTLVNNAVSGTCITDTDDATNSIYKKVTAFYGDADVILIAGGTNDYGTGKPLGEYADTTPTTFYGAMRGICTAIQTNHADATVIFVTPLPRTDNASAAVEPLNAYRNAIFEIASEYDFNVVDGSMLGFADKTGGFNDFMLADGCHPTQAGHDFYAKNLYAALM